MILGLTWPLESAAFHAAGKSRFFGDMGLRERIIEQTSPGTCDWPLTHQAYQSWLTRTDLNCHRGLLWLVGNPGSGKSVLVKKLASTYIAQSNLGIYFFDARGSSSLEKSTERVSGAYDMVSWQKAVSSASSTRQAGGSILAQHRARLSLSRQMFAAGPNLLLTAISRLCYRRIRFVLS